MMLLIGSFPKPKRYNIEWMNLEMSSKILDYSDLFFILVNIGII